MLQMCFGGFVIHAAFEFKEWRNWHFHGLLEYMDGWYDRQDLLTVGEMMYQSKSLYATARSGRRPRMFKTGGVNAVYNVLQENMTQYLREVSDTGYGYGTFFGNESFRLDLLDYKRIGTISDSFDSTASSPGILFGPGSSLD